MVTRASGSEDMGKQINRQMFASPKALAVSAGLIGEDEAKKRRSDVTQEADFYGSMDGASKFVRGDAIAGLLILFINLIGGIEEASSSTPKRRAKLNGKRAGIRVMGAGLSVHETLLQGLPGQAPGEKRRGSGDHT